MRDMDATGTPVGVPRRTVPTWRKVAIGLGALILVAAVWRVVAGPSRAEAVRGELATGKIEEAARRVDDWRKARPNDPLAYAWAARVALRRRDDAAAAEGLARAEALGADRESLADIRGVLLSMAGRPAEAEPMLRSSLSKTADPCPRQAEALARVAMATFRFGLALEAIGRWKHDAPTDVAPLLLEAEVAERTAAPASEVVERFEAAVAMDPGSSRARLGLAETLMLAGRPAEALPHFDRFLKDHPDDPAAMAGAARAYVAAEQPERGEELFRQSLGRDPRQLTALKGLGQLAQRSGKLSEADDLLARAMAIDRDDFEIRYSRALVLARLGRADEAAAERHEADRLRAESAEIERLQGELLKRPTDLELLHEAARWLIEHGHAEEGIRWAERALAIRPGHAATCRLLADHFQKAGDVGLANYYRVAARE